MEKANQLNALMHYKENIYIYIFNHTLKRALRKKDQTGHGFWECLEYGQRVIGDTIQEFKFGPRKINSQFKGKFEKENILLLK